MNHTLTLLFCSLLLTHAVSADGYSTPKSHYNNKRHGDKQEYKRPTNNKQTKKTWPDSKLITGRHGAVATEHVTCSRIGTDILRQGGSAVDAAISAALCVGTIDSFASGIGGGGFMVVRDSDGNAEYINFREKAPAAASKDMYVKEPKNSVTGPLSIAVPGELRGLQLAHQKYGKLPWRKLLQPVIQLNREGFPVTEMLEKYIKQQEDSILKDPAFSSVFAPKGRILKKGEICRRPKYAETLEIIARKGVNEFYRGELSSRIVKEFQRMGAIITAKDLATYRAGSKKPLETTFRGRRIITAPPPTSGAILISILNILDKMDLRFKEGDFDEKSYHSITEAFRYGYAMRSNLGDPDFVDLKDILNRILSVEYAEAASKNITNRSFPPSHYNPNFDTVHSAGTTSLSVVAPDGQAVSLMSTVNNYFGSKVMSESTGIVWNDQMDDFSTPGVINIFGFPASPNNYIAPGKRPLSSAVPTIVENRGKVEMSIGASGGSRIISSVAQVILRNIVMDQRLDAAVTAPRIHDQLFPNELVLEADFDKSMGRRMAGRGHNVTWLKPDDTQSTVQAIRRRRGLIYAVSDGRKYGIASAF